MPLSRPHSVLDVEEASSFVLGRGLCRYLWRAYSRMIQLVDSFN
jgi:hypothetical protein